MNKKYKSLLKNIFYFLLAGFVPRIASFILLPIYTSYLKTSDLGISDLIVSTVNLLLPLLTLEVQDAVMKFSLDNTASKKSVFSIGINLSLLGAIVLLIGEIILYKTGIIHLPLHLLAYMFILYIVDSTNIIVSYFCRGLDKVKILTYSSILSSLITFLCSICFVAVFKLGLHGYLWTNIIANFSSTAYIFISAQMGEYYEIKFEKKTSIRMIKFSLPLIISALSWWINNASDKYILGYFAGTAFVGIYSVSSKIPNILSTLGTVIAKAYSMSAIKEFDKEDSDGFLGKSYSAICAGMVIGCSFLLLLNIPLAKILFSKDFFKAWKYVPFLLLSIAFNQMALSCQNIFIAQNKTKIVSKTALIGAVINTVFNIVLIPPFGALGASIATAISFFVVWELRYLILKRELNIKNQPLIEFFSFILLIFQTIFSIYGNKFIIIEMIITACITFLYRSYIKILFHSIRYYLHI